MSKPIIFSGIQPTGRKHLGNYIGAIRQYVEGQDRGEPAIFCIVDLHAISVAYDPVELRERIYDTAAILLAAGLDPERCVLFRQSDVPERSEEHTSELQSQFHLVCRLLLEKKKHNIKRLTLLTPYKCHVTLS